MRYLITGLPKGVVAGTVAAADVKVSLKDAEGKELTTTSTNTLATVSTLLSASGLADEKGPFTLTLKVGDLTVFSETFKVTDNRVAPKYSIKSNDLTVSASDKLNAAIQAALEFEKTDAQTITVTDVDFASSNEKVVVDSDVSGGTQGKDTTTEDGKTKIYVDSVTVTVAETSKDTETFTLDFKGEAFNVTSDAKATDALDALAKINGADSSVNKDTFTTAGITGVTAENLADVKATVAAAKTAKSSDLTKAEVQTAVNDTVTVLAEVEKYETTATVAASTAAETAVNTVALKSGKTAATGITAVATAVKAENGTDTATYLKLDGTGNSATVKVNTATSAITDSDVTEKVTVTITKGSATKTYTVTVTLTKAS